MRTKKQRLTLKEKKAQTRLNKMTSAKGNSKYSRKQKFLRSNGGWGFNYLDKNWA